MGRVRVCMLFVVTYIYASLKEMLCSYIHICIRVCDCNDNSNWFKCRWQVLLASVKLFLFVYSTSKIPRVECKEWPGLPSPDNAGQPDRQSRTLPYHNKTYTRYHLHSCEWRSITHWAVRRQRPPQRSVSPSHSKASCVARHHTRAAPSSANPPLGSLSSLLSLFRR